MGNGKAKGHVSACKRWSFMPPKTTFYKLKHGHSQSKNCSNYNHPIKSLFLITIFMSEMTIFCVFLHYGNIDSANNLIYIFASN